MISHSLVKAGASEHRVSLTKGQAKREEVIKAAARLFGERGYHVTSMQDIADEVGLRKGSLYYHVTSKDDLLFQIVDNEVSASLEQLERICAKPISPAEKVREAVLSLVSAIGSDTQRITLFLQEIRTLRPEQLETITLKRKRYEVLFQDILEEGNAEGVFSVAQTKIASFGLLGMCNWIHTWYRQNGGFSTAEIGGLFADLFLWGCTGNTPKQAGGRKAKDEGS